MAIHSKQFPLEEHLAFKVDYVPLFLEKQKNKKKGRKNVGFGDRSLNFALLANSSENFGQLLGLLELNVLCKIGQACTSKNC